jgi:hypothetical protein
MYLDGDRTNRIGGRNNACENVSLTDVESHCVFEASMERERQGHSRSGAARAVPSNRFGGEQGGYFVWSARRCALKVRTKLLHRSNIIRTDCLVASTQAGA